MRTKAVFAFLLFAALVAAAPATLSPARPNAVAAENAAYKLILTAGPGGIDALLVDKRSGLRLADGPLVYRADAAGHENPTVLSQMTDPSVSIDGDSLVVRGILAGLQVEHRFTLPSGKPVMDETLRLTNPGSGKVALPDFECGFTRALKEADGRPAPDLASDRWVAVPHRKRAEDAKDVFMDYSASDIADKPGFEAHPDSAQGANRRPSRHRYSDGWAWTHGPDVLGVYKFSQDAMLFSVLSTIKTPSRTLLRFGGTAMIMGEPSALTRIAPGATVDLGLTRYETFRGGAREAMYGFRRLLDERGCRFPADFDPPVHWEQLYDMEGAWDHRAERYTKAVIEAEARKGVEYSCEAIYLDPGWDTQFATFLWGEDWLGPQAAFVKEMRDRFGLKVSLHCPLATWMSFDIPMGPPGIDTYPAAAKLLPPPLPPDDAARVPAARDGRLNLALRPEAKATASSLLPGYAIHRVEHLNDGWYGNSQSWIAAEPSAWAQMDLGGAFRISRVVVGNDHRGTFSDRSAKGIRLLASRGGAAWSVLAAESGPGLGAEYVFSFPAVEADRIRIEIAGTSAGKDTPRLDEIEVYAADASTQAEVAAFEAAARRGERKSAARRIPALCLGSQAYLAAAEKRLLDLCAAGATFLMFDGNWWNGGCLDPSHGHPVPYTIEDHIRANVDLAERIHAKYPKVLIEMHDMIAGGSPIRHTPVYYTYGGPGSWDENWGYELMWDSMADIKALRCLSLYYYNLSCNVPAYLHVNLRGDNRDAVVLWWYASTCRHLGIGGTSADPAVVAAQKAAMKRYRAVEDLYKRGEFFGVSEEIHVHVRDGRIAVNVFNLDDKPRTIEGSISLSEIGLDPARAYAFDEPWLKCENGRLFVKAALGSWGAKMSAGAAR